MRCSCRECGTYMVQAEDEVMGCVCPECFNRCTDCLGTDSILTKEDIESMRDNPMLAELYLHNRTND